MYKIAICEDDERYIHILQNYILDTNIIPENCMQFFCFTSGEILLKCQEKDFDLVIMDMQMAGLNGYETAARLREYNKKLLLIFCSGVVEPTPEFFKVTPFRYLQKKYSPEKMRKELTEVIEEMQHRKSYPFVMCKRGNYGDKVRVYPDQIMYIAIKNLTTEVFVHRQSQDIDEDIPNLRSMLNIGAMQEIFNEDCGFVRAHNSYIINMAHIIMVRKDSVTLTDGTNLTISRSHAKEFREKFARYMARKYKGN